MASVTRQRGVVSKTGVIGIVGAERLGDECGRLASVRPECCETRIQGSEAMTTTRVRSGADEERHVPAPKIAECQAEECDHNEAGACCMPAVMIGDDGLCNEFRCSHVMEPSSGRSGHVVRCLLETCKHHQDGGCTAREIHVGYEWGVACLTYDPIRELQAWMT